MKLFDSSIKLYNLISLSFFKTFIPLLRDISKYYPAKQKKEENELAIKKGYLNALNIKY